MARRDLVFVAMALSACGGSMEGAVGGITMDVADGAFVLHKDPAGRADGLTVLLSDHLSVCDSIKTNTNRRSSNTLVLVFARVAEDGHLLSPAPGDHAVAPTRPAETGVYAGAFFSNFDSGCVRTLANKTATGESGLVKLEALNRQGTANGTFDITFGAGDRVTGRFAAPLCEAEFPTGPANCD